MNSLRKSWQKRIIRHSFVCLGVSALVFWSFKWSEFDLTYLNSSGPRFLEFFERLTPPNWSVTELVINSAIETIMIALSGTFLAVVMALPLGFLAASNMTPPIVSQSIKVFLALVRSIPVIVVAIVFVIAVGLGPFAGALAIAFHSVGMLGKFYAEEFETADLGIINAVSGTGATWFQTIRFGLIPQCVPQVISFSFYRFEMNFRDATFLGLVGAGGIGYYIQLYVRGFQYDKVAVLLLVISAVVMLVDQLNGFVRLRVR